MAGRVLTGREEIAAVVRAARRVAVLGIKTERQAGQPAFDVPHYLKQAGLEILPVPVYYPEVREILGVPVARRVQDVEGPVDILDVFRRSQDLEPHLDDIIAKRPKLVWLQSGIRDDRFARALLEQGMDVVQDRCLMVEHRFAASLP
ncbi:MAG TPA: CoA-binding protein [Polyangiales bacterium]